MKWNVNHESSNRNVKLSISKYKSLQPESKPSFHPRRLKQRKNKELTCILFFSALKLIPFLSACFTLRPLPAANESQNWLMPSRTGTAALENLLLNNKGLPVLWNYYCVMFMLRCSMSNCCGLSQFSHKERKIAPDSLQGGQLSLFMRNMPSQHLD